MWNEPNKEQLASIPRLYDTEMVPLQDKLIHLHFFIGGCDWYVAEYDGKDLFWGFSILNEDSVNAEWGYISLEELRSAKINGWMEVDCDRYWKIRKAAQVDKIQACDC